MTDTPKQQPTTTSYPTTNMTSLTDAQLRQTITQLSNAANTQYQHYQPAHASSSQTQSTPAAKAYLKNIHTWSTSTTPRGSTRGRGRTKTVPVAPASVPAAPAFAPPPTLYAHHPAHIPGSVMGMGVGGVSGSTIPGLAAPAALPLPAPAPAPPTGPSNPPKHPLPVTLQASHSTYASRLRTGSTLLMQPILSGTSTSTSSTAGTTALTARPSTRRTTGMVNYAEPGSGDEFPDAGALDSDDSDFVASGGTRTAVRQSRAAARMGAGMSNGMGVFYSGNGASTTTQGGRGVSSTPGITTTATTTAGMGTTEKVELSQSYLGMIPPSKFIKARPVGLTAYEYPSLDTLFTHAQARTSLVPIRVEFDTDTHRIRDCFVWNLYETLVKPEMFARVFCADLELPVVPWAETVANQIRAQLEEHEGVASLDLGVDGCYGCDVGFQFGCRYGYVGGNVWDGTTEAGGEGNDQNWEEPFPENGGEIPECRVILSIDVQIATHHLMDHIEWDLLSPLTPEDFSKQLCAELGLAGEAIPLIAHAVHEELIKHKRDAIEWGVIGGDHRESVAGPGALAGGGGGEEAERRAGGGGGGGGVLKDKTGLGLAWGRTPRENRGPKTLQSVWREWSEAEEFRTRFEELTAEEVEKREIERERASRRLRRETSKFQTTRTRRR